MYFQALESFLWVAGDLLDRLDDWREDITRNDFAEDVSAVKRAIEVHDEIKEKIMRAPFDDVDAMGQELLKRWEIQQIRNDILFWISMIKER